jgi:rubrerythrin
MSEAPLSLEELELEVQVTCPECGYIDEDGKCPECGKVLK